jgi:ABC-type polysaccharide/polyol phosphate transport system ATPase subunit
MSKLEPASARADLQPGWTGGGLEVATAGIEPTKEAAVTAGTAIGDAVSSLETEAQKDSARADLQSGRTGDLGVATVVIEPTKEAAVRAGAAVGDAVSSLAAEARKVIRKRRSPRSGAAASRAQKKTRCSPKKRAKAALGTASGKIAAAVPFSDTKTLSETHAAPDIAINIRKVSYWRCVASHLRPRRTRNEVLNQLLEFGSMFVNLQSFLQGEISGRQLEKRLDELSIQIPRGSVVCVADIGGLSRTPLMRIVAKMTPPKSGEVILKGRVISLEQADVLPVPYRTVRYNLFSLGALLGVGRKEILSAFPSMEAFTGRPEFFDMPVRSVPKSKLFDIALSLICSGPFDIIVVEEVRKIVSESWLRFVKEAPQRGKTLLISSSKLEEALDLSTHALLLDKGRLLDFGATHEVTARHGNFVEAAMRASTLVIEDDKTMDDDQDDDM